MAITSFELPLGPLALREPVWGLLRLLFLADEPPPLVAF